MHRDDEVRSIVGYRDDELLVMPAYSRRHVALFAGVSATRDATASFC